MTYYLSNSHKMMRRERERERESNKNKNKKVALINKQVILFKNRILVLYTTPLPYKHIVFLLF